MTSSELTEKLTRCAQEAEALQKLWCVLIPDLQPDARQFLLWLELHPLDRMVYAVKRTGAKHVKLAGTMSLEHAVRFCSKVANVRKTEAETKTTTAAA
jgi:hypothetical protein